MNNYIYCLNNTALAVQKYSVDGILIWSFPTNQLSRWGIEVDANNDIYYGADDGIVRKLSSNGVEQRSTNLSTGGRVWRLTVDDVGNVYIIQENNIITKLNSLGAVVWTYSFSPSRVGSAIAIDNNKNVYIASRNLDGNDQIIKLIQNTDGTSVSIGWTISNINNVEFIAVNPTSEFVYAVSKGSTRFIKKINALNGSVIWSVVPNANIALYCVAVGLDESIYVSGSSGTAYKINPINGAIVWTLIINANALLGVSLDLMSNICFASSPGGIFIVRESSDGLSAQIIRNITTDQYHMVTNDPGVFHVVLSDYYYTQQTQKFISTQTYSLNHD